MMDVVEDLVKRGIISPDAAKTFAQRLQELDGNLPGNVDVRGPGMNICWQAIKW